MLGETDDNYHLKENNNQYHFMYNSQHLCTMNTIKLLDTIYSSAHLALHNILSHCVTQKQKVTVHKVH